MGFTPKRTVYVLDFAGTELDGLEVRTVPISTDQFLETQDITARVTGNLEYIQQMAPVFLSVLQGWNLEDQGGEPVPQSLKGLMSQDIHVVTAIFDAWIDVMTGVSAPLDPPSSDGEPSLVESIPMETLSPSPEPLPGPS